MSRHLPALSGRELIRALRRSGFVVLRQKGSHVSVGKNWPAKHAKHAKNRSIEPCLCCGHRSPAG